VKKSGQRIFLGSLITHVCGTFPFLCHSTPFSYETFYFLLGCILPWLKHPLPRCACEIWVEDGRKSYSTAQLVVALADVTMNWTPPPPSFHTSRPDWGSPIHTCQRPHPISVRCTLLRAEESRRAISFWPKQGDNSNKQPFYEGERGFLQQSRPTTERRNCPKRFCKICSVGLMICSYSRIGLKHCKTIPLKIYLSWGWHACSDDSPVRTAKSGILPKGEGVRSSWFPPLTLWMRLPCNWPPKPMTQLTTQPNT